MFLVTGIVRSVYTGELGVTFFDRNGGIRAFWNKNNYEVVKEEVKNGYL